MKIVLVSDYAGFADEGTRKTAFYMRKELSKRHRVLHLRVRDAFSIKLWRQLRGFKPQIIHFLPGPTVKSFVMVRALKALYPWAKTVMSAYHPVLRPLAREFVRLMKPDMVLVQSLETERLLRALGCETMFLPCGVDLEKFTPSKDKRKLRAKYGIYDEGTIILHVGSLNRRRNVLLLNRIAKETHSKVLVVGSISIPYESEVLQALMHGGCTVIRKYIQSIEEVYALSDCYVFPVFNRQGSIEFPISVAEAMACNLPVVTTRFGALPRLFEPGDGLYYAQDEEELIELVQRALRERAGAWTREKVLPYSWGRIVEKLEEIYAEVMADE